MIEVERVDFVSVPTQNLVGSVTFYGEVLGLPRNPNVPQDFAEFETSNVTLGLWQPELQGVPFEPNSSGFALRVPDVDTARRELEDAGVEFLGETMDTGVCHMGFCKDPDGNVLILHRRYAPKPG